MIIPFPLSLTTFLPMFIPIIIPFPRKMKLRKLFKNFSPTGVIHPSTSPYYSPVVMVLKKEGSWCMCPDFHALNKLTIKDKFPIPVIDDLLDELSGAQVLY
jgi:hypothetical protein